MTSDGYQTPGGPDYPAHPATGEEGAPRIPRRDPSTGGGVPHPAITRQGGSPPPRSAASNIVTILVVLGGLGFLVIFFILPFTTAMSLGQSTAFDDVLIEGNAEQRIMVVEVSGILMEDMPGMFGGSYDPVAAFESAMADAESDKSVCAVIVRINSPGGSVTASDELHAAVQDFRRRNPKVPVVGLMRGVAASGGYYMAVPMTKLVAEPTTITGSVGVIMSTLDYSEGMAKLGIKGENITSGPFKDTGDGFRPMREDEREYLQGIVNTYYERFVKLVSEGRRLSQEQVRVFADGRIFVADEALALGMIDQVGYLADAAKTAESLAGVSGAQVFRIARRQGLLAALGASSTTPERNTVDRLVTQVAGPALRPGFYYLWQPGVR